MGQARRRGSFEDRQRAAIAARAEESARIQLEFVEERRRQQEMFDALSPEEQDKIVAERKARERRRNSALGALGIAAALLGFSMSNHRRDF